MLYLIPPFFVVAAQWLDFQELLGGKWDIYLISILVGCVVILILWRTRH